MPLAIAVLQKLEKYFPLILQTYVIFRKMDQCKLFADNNVHKRAKMFTKITKHKVRYRLEMVLATIMQLTEPLYLSEVEETILEEQLEKIKNIVFRKRYQGTEVIEIYMCVRKLRKVLTTDLMPTQKY